MAKMQEEFEEWVNSFLDDEKDTLDLYDAWQASRKALVVELPDWDCYDTPMQAIEACKDRLSAAGVSYDE